MERPRRAGRAGRALPRRRRAAAVRGRTVRHGPNLHNDLDFVFGLHLISLCNRGCNKLSS